MPTGRASSPPSNTANHWISKPRYGALLLPRATPSSIKTGPSMCSHGRSVSFQTRANGSTGLRLSGGEKARSLIAQLMAPVGRPADSGPANERSGYSSSTRSRTTCWNHPNARPRDGRSVVADCISTWVLALDGTGRAEWFADYAQREPHMCGMPEMLVGPRPHLPGREEFFQTERVVIPRTTGVGQIEEQILKAEKAVTSRQAAANDPAVASCAEALIAVQCASSCAGRSRTSRRTLDELDEKRTRYCVTARSSTRQVARRPPLIPNGSLDAEAFGSCYNGSCLRSGGDV